MRKKGSFDWGWNETGGLIIAAVCALIIATVIFVLVRGSIQTYDASSKSYLELFEEKISRVSEGRSSDFLMWGIKSKDVSFYLIYFGDAVLGTYEGKEFSRNGYAANSFCVCHEKDKLVCNNCKSLKYPSVMEGSGEVWGVSLQERVNISLEGGKYVFRKI